MFDIGATELLVIVIVAIVVIGPKDIPLALRTAGRWIGKVRRMSTHFRTGIDAMIREAEMEDMEQKWREQNARIMAEHDPEQMAPLEIGQAAAEARTDVSQDREGPQGDSDKSAAPATGDDDDQPGLPLDKPTAK